MTAVCQAMQQEGHRAGQGNLVMVGAAGLALPRRVADQNGPEQIDSRTPASPTALHTPSCLPMALTNTMGFHFSRKACPQQVTPLMGVWALSLPLCLASRACEPWLD